MSSSPFLSTLVERIIVLRFENKPYKLFQSEIRQVIILKSKTDNSKTKQPCLDILHGYIYTQ